MKTPRKLVCLLPLLLVVGGCAQLGIFTFDDPLQDTSTPGTQWAPGDPWDQRTVTTIADSRDTSLEDHINVAYYPHEFTASLRQGAAVAATTTAVYTVGARVDLDIAMSITGTGTNFTAMNVDVTGVPTARPNIGASARPIGIFRFEHSGGSAIYVGGVTMIGTVMSFTWGGTTLEGLGLNPNFAIASGDQLIIQFSYLPATS